MAVMVRLEVLADLAVVVVGKILVAQELLGKDLLAVVLMELQANTLLAVAVAQVRLAVQ
jgi:hypothetical protein